MSTSSLLHLVDLDIDKTLPQFFLVDALELSKGEINKDIHTGTYREYLQSTFSEARESLSSIL